MHRECLFAPLGGPSSNPHDQGRLAAWVQMGEAWAHGTGGASVGCRKSVKRVAL